MMLKTADKLPPALSLRFVSNVIFTLESVSVLHSLQPDLAHNMRSSWEKKKVGEKQNPATAILLGSML